MEDFPVRKWEGHRRIISRSRRLMARKPRGKLRGPELDSSSGTGEERW